MSGLNEGPSVNMTVALDQLCTAESKVRELEAENEALVEERDRALKARQPLQFVNRTDEAIAEHFKFREVLNAIADFDAYEQAIADDPDFDDDECCNRHEIALRMVKELAQDAVRPGDSHNIKVQREAALAKVRAEVDAIQYGETYYDRVARCHVVRLMDHVERGVDMSGLVCTRVVEPRRDRVVGYEGCSYARDLAPQSADPLMPIENQAGVMTVRSAPHGADVGRKAWLTEVRYSNGALILAHESASRAEALAEHQRQISYWTEPTS